MKRHYFIGNFLRDKNILICLDTEIVHQLKNVLKIKSGEEVMLGDGEGSVFIVSVVGVDKKQATFSIIDEKNTTKIKNKTTLYAALLKRDNFEWLVQKTVEAGVDRIVPMITERTVKNSFNAIRLKKIIKEASEQCERPFLPEISAPVNFKEAIKTEAGGVLFHPNGSDFKKLTKDFRGIIFIGPEGGFTEEELELAKNNNLYIANLGGNILRGETAATIAVYLAKNNF